VRGREGIGSGNDLVLLVEPSTSSAQASDDSDHSSDDSESEPGDVSSDATTFGKRCEESVGIDFDGERFAGFGFIAFEVGFGETTFERGRGKADGNLGGRDRFFVKSCSNCD
jgi:hypothetical protein